MRNWAVKSMQRVASRFGLRLVRWPTMLRSDQDAGTHRFFPVGEHRPWTVPPDLRARTEPWARVLTSVYDDHASWPSSIAPEAGLLLHALVRNIAPRTIVETGTCLGVSTIWMASALRDTWAAKPASTAPASVPPAPPTLHTFDLFSPPPDDRLAASSLFQDRRSSVLQRFIDAGLDDLIHIHQGDSAAQLAASHAPLRDTGGVQLAYIDGDHSPRGALADFHAVEPVLAVGGYVVLHDTFPDVCNHLGPRWLIDHLAEVTSCTYQVCELYTAQTNYGLALLRRLT